MTIAFLNNLSLIVVVQLSLFESITVELIRLFCEQSIELYGW